MGRKKWDERSLRADVREDGGRTKLNGVIKGDVGSFYTLMRFSGFQMMNPSGQKCSKLSFAKE